jgi:hypothetical protein
MLPTQNQYLTKQSPRLHKQERHTEVSAPGERLVCLSIPTRGTRSCNEVYIHVIVDEYSGFAFGIVNNSPQGGNEFAKLQKFVTSHFSALGLDAQFEVVHEGFHGLVQQFYDFVGWNTHVEFFINDGWHLSDIRQYIKDLLEQYNYEDRSVDCVDTKLTPYDCIEWFLQ